MGDIREISNSYRIEHISYGAISVNKRAKDGQTPKRDHEDPADQVELDLVKGEETDPIDATIPPEESVDQPHLDISA
ncbi:MAG: hypothetical protein ACKVQS_00185 [Fimbriimonadaceae bacterium]